MLDHFAALETGGATTGSSAIVLSFHSGANETGDLVTTAIILNHVTSPSVFNSTIGTKTPAGFYAFNLAKLSGLPADKSITAGNEAGCFQIIDNQWLAWSGTYGGAKTCASPLTGANAYTLTIHDSATGRDFKVNETVNTNEYNAGPSVRDTANDTGQIQTVLELNNHQCGDVFYVESGTMTHGFSNWGFSPPTAGAIPCPTAPWVGGWSPNGLRTPDPGWFTMQARDPLTVDLNSYATSGVAYLAGSGTNTY